MSKKNGNVRQEMRLEQVREFDSAVIKALPGDMTKEVAQGWIGNARKLRLSLRQVLMLMDDERKVIVVDADSAVGKFAEEWEQIYRDVLGIPADFSQTRVAICRPGLDLVTFITSGITCNQVYTKCESLFPSWRWAKDLDAAVKGRNDREPNGNYGIWTYGGAEPPAMPVHLTADKTRQMNYSGTTLLEELLAELRFWKLNKQHRNIENITRCDGSRISGGNVPSVYCFGDKFYVNCYGSGNSDGSLRPRVAVS